VAFLVAYSREAHPEDGWVLSSNREQGIAVHDPASAEERASVGAACASRLGIRIPAVVDGVDRPYLIGRDGRVAFQGDEGPFGFEPDLRGQAIELELAR